MSPSTLPNVPELSVVIPVFNGAPSVGGVVDEIHQELAGTAFEIVLVNDGSSDDSEQVCLGLAARYPSIIFVQLDRNFGEHNAVLAGLHRCRGDYVCVMDDDGQNSPADAVRMLAHLKTNGCDVVYARYPKRQHSAFRVAGSWFNDRVATLVLGKPSGLYLSSFKVMNRTVVDRVREYTGSRPYLDALLLRVTRSIGQVVAEHRPRRVGRSGYTLSKLVDLWLSMVLGGPVTPLRMATLATVVVAALALLIAAGIAGNSVLFSSHTTAGMPWLAAVVLTSCLAQLLALVLLGGYIRHVILLRRGSPQYVLRYVRYPEGRTPQGAAVCDLANGAEPVAAASPIWGGAAHECN
jgi:undecaprenyl-phosphate 4-deoxy-4-formamido-L-arabinose transferase